MQALLEIKSDQKDDFNLNQILRKRMRDSKAERIKKEEENKKPKNFGL